MTVVNEANAQAADYATSTQTIHAAVLDSAHLGDIHGALGSIAEDDFAPRSNLRARLQTLLAILGPGLIVMVGDNDAGAFGTYTQAGQNYGTTLLWTLVLLIPVLYVNQEMVLRLGAVTGVGHARLIFERFGRFWGAFSVIDLFILNALTIVTEFIGITLALDYLGVPKLWGVVAAAALVMFAASTGNFRRFERFALMLVLGSFLIFPVLLFIHPPAGQMIQDMMVPKMPQGAALNEVMLLIIAIVGTTVAPWQLFFQQSYVVDKRITPRFIRYERVDLMIGIAIVIAGAMAIMAFTAQTFAGHPEFGNFVDAGAVSAGMEKYFGKAPAVFFALALLDACIIGASAVSLSTAYALGDVFSWRHSLHRKPTEAKGFYAIYCGLIVLAAVLVLTPDVQLGLLTSAVQTLAGVLLPGATVFLLLLCNDKAVLGPWVNSRKLNLFTGGVVAVLVMLSVILTGSVLFPGISDTVILSILIGGSAVGIVTALGASFAQRRLRRPEAGNIWSKSSDVSVANDSWRMPPLDQLPAARLSLASRIWMIVLRGYLVIAGGLVLFRIFQLATGGA
ncbi:NRAMP family divalent metal transporter [Bradyrhizobium ganzhouense]|uniref:NRAMP family divalent metal transporter n=1 Tax=Bradyrhizobium ganzhouense TaxID=1179767 RepID=UPI003CF9DEE9